MFKTSLYMCNRFDKQLTIFFDNIVNWKLLLLTSLIKMRPLKLSLLGYLKTRICWGGGQFDPPPSKSHVLCPNMTNDTSLESACALLLESAKNYKFAKIEFFSAKSSYIVKIFATKILSKKWKIRHFWKALHNAISNMQKVLLNFK